MSTDPVTLDKLYKAGKVLYSPCKNLPNHRSTCYDDRFILDLADKFDAAVVSRDYYRDLLNENPSKRKIKLASLLIKFNLILFIVCINRMG